MCTEKKCTLLYFLKKIVTLLLLQQLPAAVAAAAGAAAAAFLKLPGSKILYKIVLTLVKITRKIQTNI